MSAIAAVFAVSRYYRELSLMSTCASRALGAT
jgi:hypothetical protein